MSSEILTEFEGKKLTLPALPSNFIALEKVTESVPLQAAHLQANVPQPFAATEVVEAFVTNITTIVEGEDVKPVNDLTFKYQHDTGHRFWPGDTIGILPYNADSDVDYILDRLNLLSQSDNVCNVGIDPTSTKKGAKIPMFVPSVVNYRRLFKECLDLHAVPKKLLIRSLASYTTDDDDRRTLEILCSKEGNSAYEKIVLQNGTGIISLLQLVPSCRPTAAILVAHLPRLMPRPYSIANVYQEGDSPAVRLLFSHNAHNPGITTTYLRGLEKGATIYFYFRQSSAFVYKDMDVKRNIVMVGTGTGISPYLSFLQLRAEALAKGETLGRAELFVGFRYRERNYLCKDEIEEYLRAGVLDACNEAFSRDTDTRHKYVQSQLKEKRSQIIENIRNPHALLYVCGDSKILLPQITNTVVDILTEASEAEEDIKTLISGLKKDGKYREDIWL
ncbi:methionine synthase reductase-like [Anopheles marshallii]|uniref:methionine synthase reductase-like n=1 Tax=Anopheles marshallii TaxID=1521116 RepID=UPI00237C03E2|nr:methionine synthase reductase-like [Anopheles marshallii]